MWLIPSRERPHRLTRLMEACRKTKMSTAAVVLLDTDDPNLPGYLRLPMIPEWTIEIGLRSGLSEIYNRAFARYPDEVWYGTLCDDVVPETDYFDLQLIEVAGSDSFSFGDDGINGGKHGTHFVVGGDLVRSVGWLSLPGLNRIYIDTVWNDIAHDRSVYYYLPHIKLTHHHFSNGKALMDKTYKKHNKDRDKSIYEAWSIEYHNRRG
ncbi:hypothetical protein LCGC14_2380620 [marine sediment metagenome]|uniref:Glycosyltransferase 2-like domain-containing protein n=1 Tax=marine sediment metagenome TaxID=412755 RepID=A0A0F9C116_9ZZZZ